MMINIFSKVDFLALDSVTANYMSSGCANHLKFYKCLRWGPYEIRFYLSFRPRHIELARVSNRKN